MTTSADYVVPTAASPDHEIVSSRVLPFPREKVFAAWTHPDLHAQWWGPAGFTNTFYTYDPRPGGQWRFTMHGPDGTDYENVSVFEHLEPDTCIVFKHVCQPEFTMVATFADDGEGTRMEWHMIFATAEICAAIASFAVGKNEENFDRLEKVLSDTPTDSPVWRELKLMREIDATPDAIWKVWTERLQEWWCPLPWTTPECDMELRSGGRFRTLMRGPNPGEEHNLEGVFLEVVPEQRVIFTDAYSAGWLPNAGVFMTGGFTFEALAGGKTRYTAFSRHWSAEKQAEHRAMGFHFGWGAAADQLIALVNSTSAQ